MKPYLPDRDHFFDEDEWDRFMTLSETEAEAEVTAADREYTEWLNNMTPLASYRYWRRYILTSIMENRRRLRNPDLTRVEIINEMWRHGIARSQRSLVKWRHYRTTGVWPGEA